eukprot:6258926-Pyramimonas_sp.AAC.1
MLGSGTVPRKTQDESGSPEMGRDFREGRRCGKKHDDWGLSDGAATRIHPLQRVLESSQSAPETSSRIARSQRFPIYH